MTEFRDWKKERKKEDNKKYYMKFVHFATQRLCFNALCSFISMLHWRQQTRRLRGGSCSQQFRYFRSSGITTLICLIACRIYFVLCSILLFKIIAILCSRVISRFNSCTFDAAAVVAALKRGELLHSSHLQSK